MLADVCSPPTLLDPLSRAPISNFRALAAIAGVSIPIASDESYSALLTLRVLQLEEKGHGLRERLAHEQ